MKISVSENGNEKEDPIMNYQTAEQLTSMKLHAMRLEYARQDELPASEELPFDDRLGMIVNAQYTERQKAKIKRLIKQAELREPTASLAELDYDPVRKLKKADVAKLADCEWIKNGSNLIITGATGVGKTYLLSAKRSFKLCKHWLKLCLFKNLCSHSRTTKCYCIIISKL